MNLRNTYNDKNDFFGIYRGFVVWNDDPKVRGRIKVFVPGVYDDKFETQPANLPWARPFSPSFGGGSINPNNEDRHVLNDEVGWCSVPHAGDMKTGSQVFLFFENGDINFPVYFGVAQSQEGWFSEHPNQHCFRSDNIRVRIDENVKDPRSTCKFNSYNSRNSEVAKKNLERDCEKFLWKFNKDEGNIEQLETRLDIEIEATKMNAVNLNIHGNVNLHIDGDWFVEHIGNKYEYQEGDLYVKHDGNTYIEENGHFRKVLNGNHTYEHNGNSVENQEGDTLITRTGTYFSQIDNDVTHMYNGNYKIKVNGNTDEITRNDKIVEVGNGVHVNVGDNVNTIIGGHLSVNVDTHIDLDSKGNFEMHSKSGNIILKTDGEFELMDGKKITCEGFKNLGTKGNIQIISTFGNINIQCIKNENLANFLQRATVIPWNPDFVRQIKENVLAFPDVSPTANALKGMEFPTDIEGLGDYIELLKNAQELLIYDGLPVFLPGKMIVQNPNIVSPNNADDVSWITTFRDEAKDWRSIKDDVMWKLPGRLMGNINIETWSGDINVKTKSELGCAGNINIQAEEKLGTFNGYKIGTLNFSANGKERIYPDPRDLFLDSDFFAKNAGMLMLFTHGTNPEKGGEVLEPGCRELLRQTGYTYDFLCTNYNKFYDMYGINIVTKGFSMPLDDAMRKRLRELKTMDPPKLGCAKCIGDYLLGMPDVMNKFYEGKNLVELVGGYHMYGFQRFNPLDTSNTRGTFNIESGDYDKISMGDGHAIASKFIRRDFGSSNIGGMTFSMSGDIKYEVGRNQYKSLNLKNPKKEIIENYEHIETPYDYHPPKKLQDLFKVMQKMYEASPAQYIKVEDGKITLEPNRGSRPFEAAGGFKNLEIMPEIKWKDGGYISEYTRKIGEERIIHEVEDKRCMIDFGFDFDRAKDLIESQDPRGLEMNVKENEMFYVTIDRGADTEYHEGGNSRWFQIRNFDNPDKKLHIEISANFNAHKYKFQDRNKAWMKSHDYHDYGFVWWDDNYFDSDLVQWFPDSEFDIESVDTDKIWNEITKTKSYHSWSKYGNHIKNELKHKEYNKPTSRCNASYKVKKGGEKMVDTVPELWVNKKGAGVDVTRNIIVTANQIDKSHFTLHSANCGKNQNIETSEVWNAATHIYQKLAKTAGKNLFNEEWYKSDVNRNTITYTAAVNTNLLTLDSDHVVLTPDGEQEGGVMMGTNSHTLHAGNLMKTELIGNQDYFNFEPPEDKKIWQYDKQYTNNFEISQNGFHKNSFKILNGTDTYIPKEGKDPEFAKALTNELVISNGGYGDEECKPSEVTYYSAEIGDGVQGSAIHPVSSTNYIYISNGNNVSTPEINAFRFENGTAVPSANNSIEFENGSNNTYGGNIFRVDNQGKISADYVTNSITLNNDNNITNLILSDYQKDKKVYNPIISQYSLGTINNHAAIDHIIEAPKGTMKFNEYFFDSIESTLKTFSTTFDTSFFAFKTENMTEDVRDLTIKTETVEFNSKVFTIKTKETYLNAESFGVFATTYAINSKLMTTMAENISQIGTNTDIKGTNISIQGKEVKMSKVIATGEFTGHLQGSSDGVAMNGGYVYLLTPIRGTARLVPAGKGVKGNPLAPESPSEPEMPEMNDTPKPISNTDNANTNESKSISLIALTKKIINKFITLELSLLDVMNGK